MTLDHCRFCKTPAYVHVAGDNPPERLIVSDIKFVNSIPDGAPNRVQAMVDALAARPGEWAELGRFPAGHHGRAYARGYYMKTKNENVQIATRTIEGQVVLFARVAG